MNNSGKTSISNGLRPAAYQLVPLLKLLETDLNGILISDGVGVGKTISAGYVMTYFSAFLKRPSFVVVPPSLVHKWLIELKGRFNRVAIGITNTGELPAAISEIKQDGEFHKSRVYVISNSLLRNEAISEIDRLALVVFDEIHTYRNKETHLYKAALSLAKRAHFRLGLSATPINNSLEDIVSEFSILLPDFDWDVIKIVIEDSWVAEREVLSVPLLTRFVKEKLGIHFARRNITNLRVTYPPEYYNWVRSAVSRISEGRDVQHGHFETITLFRLAASSPRAFAGSVGEKPPDNIQDSKLVMLQNILSQSKSSHILVFCEFKETVRLLEDNIDCRPVYSITGDTPLFERTSTIDEFRNDLSGVLVMTSIGSEGLDLQFADTVINYDLHWNPMKIEQRIGRIDRIGQEKNDIHIYNLIVDGSIDERVLTVVREKLTLVSDSVLGTSPILGESLQTPLFDDDSLDAEISSSNRLAEALQWTNTIPTEDYDILEHIDLSFCDLDKLERAAVNNVSDLTLLLKSDLSEIYLEKIRSYTSKTKDLLEYYS